MIGGKVAKPASATSAAVTTATTPGAPARGIGRDGADYRMGAVRALEGGVQLARQSPIVGVTAAAGDQSRIFPAAFEITAHS